MMILEMQNNSLCVHPVHAPTTQRACFTIPIHTTKTMAFTGMNNPPVKLPALQKGLVTFWGMSNPQREPPSQSEFQTCNFDHFPQNDGVQL